MSIQALGYVGVRAKSLEDWAAYGQNFLGLQKVDKTRNAMAFRKQEVRRGFSYNTPAWRFPGSWTR